MGLLGDIFSTIDSAKRRASAFGYGLLSDPVETVRQQVANNNNEAGQNLDALGSLYKDAQGKVTFNRSLWSPQAVAANDSLTNQLTGAMMGATVWHGSPHVFNKFDSSKIGTGEGAQVYGHGLYVAENPAVAKGYQETLAPSEFVLKGGGKYNPDDPLHMAAAELHDATAQGVDRMALAQQLRQKELGYRARNSEWASLEADKLNTMWKAIATNPQSLPEVGVNMGGGLYKVDLPDQHIAKMLDWDKPLSAQPHVRKAMGIPDAPTGEVFKEGNSWAVRNPVTGEVLSRNWANEQTARKMGALPADPVHNMTGRQYYEKLQQDARDYAITAGKNDQTTLGATQAKASQDLADFGIPGIRYLDGMSRAQGGTSNYVVFPGNENLLTIQQRNGQPLP